MIKLAFSLLEFPKDSILGVGYWCRNFIAYISEELLNTYDVHITFFVTGNYNHRELFQIRDTARITIKHIPDLDTYSKRILFEIFTFRRYLKDFDVFFNPNALYMPFLHKKIVLKAIVHDMIPFFKKDLNRLPWARKLWRMFIIKWTINHCNRILTVSNNSKKEIIARLKIDERKIAVVYMFVPQHKENHSKAIQNADNNYFVICNTVQKGKNVDGMIKAFIKYCIKYNDTITSLYIIGKEGFYVETIKAQVTEEYRGRIIFTGYLSDELKTAYISRAIALLYCSFYEGFGTPPLEAMNLGIPSIVSNTSSLPEVVGDAGIQVQPDNIDAIADAMNLLMDSKIRKSLIERMPEQLEKFDPDIQIEQWFKYITG
jgi:glycosyltransferase involved in cell wall biosynthesis